MLESTIWVKSRVWPWVHRLEGRAALGHLKKEVHAGLVSGPGVTGKTLRRCHLRGVERGVYRRSVGPLSTPYPVGDPQWNPLKCRATSREDPHLRAVVGLGVLHHGTCRVQVETGR